MLSPSTLLALGLPRPRIQLVLAANDAKDVASFNLISGQVSLVLAVNDAQDVASFSVYSDAQVPIVVPLILDGTFSYTANTTPPAPQPVIIQPIETDNTVSYKANTIASILYWQEVANQQKALQRYR